MSRRRKNRQSRGNDKLLPHRRLLGLRTIVKCKFKHFDIYSNCFYQCSSTARTTRVHLVVRGSHYSSAIINSEPLRKVENLTINEIAQLTSKSHDLWFIYPSIDFFSSSDSECLRGGFFITGSFLSWILRNPHNSVAACWLA